MQKMLKETAQIFFCLNGIKTYEDNFSQRCGIWYSNNFFAFQKQFVAECSTSTYIQYKSMKNEKGRKFFFQ